MFITSLFQVSVRGQDIPNTYGIFPSPAEAPAVEEEQSNENNDKGDMVLLQPATGNCLCVPYYLCNDDNTLNTNGLGIIDIRFASSLMITLLLLEILCYHSFGYCAQDSANYK